jgi:hypothetical protein
MKKNVTKLNEGEDVVTWGMVAKLFAALKGKKNKQDAATAIKGFGKLGASLVPGLDFLSNVVDMAGNAGDTINVGRALMGISRSVSNLEMNSPKDSKLKGLTGPFWDALKLSPELSILLDDKIEVEFINNVIIPQISNPKSENEPLPNMDIELGKWLNNKGLKSSADIFFTGKSGNISEEINRIKKIMNIISE